MVLTLTATQFRMEMKETLEKVVNEDYVLITHRDNPDRIIVTKEYFDRMEKLYKSVMNALENEKLEENFEEEW